MKGLQAIQPLMTLWNWLLNTNDDIIDTSRQWYYMQAKMKVESFNLKRLWIKYNLQESELS